METKDKEEVLENAENSQDTTNQEDTTQENITSEDTESEEEQPKESVEEWKEKYLRLYAEFDNFRRRSAKERIELIGSAGKDLMTALLPVLDDMSRAEKSIEEAKEIEALKEGVNLVFSKFRKTLENKGLKPLESTIGKDFDTDFHEAITSIPAPEESLKGKVVDEIEKGYYLNDKIIRYAKVVTGA